MKLRPRRLAPAARNAMAAHARACGASARTRYGDVDLSTLLLILEDRTVVRFPVRLRFSSDQLEPGEFAWPEQNGEHPAEGFTMHVHPRFSSRPDDLAWLIAYQIVVVNYGEVATNLEAEAFGAALMGVGEDDYYEGICRLSDELTECTSTELNLTCR